MQTPTHVLIAAAAFARPGGGAINAAALAGGFLPDAFLFAAWGWSKIAGVSEEAFWSQHYWTDDIQLGQAISNSFPLFGALLAASLVFIWRAASIFAGAGLIHLVCDFALHAKDAHRHFWPVSDWRFQSPLSYWDPVHFGVYVGLAEATLGCALIVLVFRRFRALWIRSLLLVAGAAYPAVLIYFLIALDG